MFLKPDTDQVLRSLFEQNGTAMVTYKPINDGENFIILEINQKVEEIEKVKRDEVIGKLITDVWPGVNENKFLDNLRHVYHTGEGTHIPTTLYSDSRIQGYRDNTIIKLPSKNILCIYQDKTDEVMTKESLVQTQQNFGSLIERHPAATIVSIEDKIVFANQEAATLFGYEHSQELIGNDIIDQVHPDQKELVKTRSALRRSGEAVPSSYQLKILTPDGETKYIENRVTLFDWEGQLAILGAFVDITENIVNQDKLNTIRQLARDLSYAFTIEKIADISLSAISNVINTDFTTFQIIDDEYLFTVASDPYIDPLRMRLDGKGITIRAANTKQSVLVNDVLNYDDYFVYNNQTRSELAVPVLVDNEAIAVLNVESFKVDNFSDQDQTILEIFSEDVALAISRLSYMNDLLLSEQRFRHVLNSSPDPVLVVNEDRILFTNQEGAAFFHFDNPEDSIGVRISDKLPHYDDLNFEKIIPKLLVGETDNEQIQFTLKSTLDDSEKHLEGNLQVIDYENEPAVFISFRDITDLKTHQRRLEILHRHTLDLEKSSSFEEIVEITKEALKESLNYGILDLVKVEDDQLKDLTPFFDGGGYFSHIDGPGVIAKVAREQESVLIHDTQGIDYVPRAGDAYYRSELCVPVVVKGKTSMVINVENSEPNAFSNQDQSLIETFASHIAAALDRINTLDNMERIITERTETLRSMENRYENIIKTFNIGVFEFRYEDNNIWLSNQFQQQVGYEEEYNGDYRDIVDGAMDIIHEDDRELLIDSVRSAFLEYNPIDMEIRFLLPNTPQKWLQISGHPIFVEGKPSKVLGISIDITPIKELERQLRTQNTLLQELDEMKDQFITTATHELRTPVASILGYVNYVLENEVDSLEPHVHQDIIVIQRNAQRLVDLTNDLLDVQRITTGRFEIMKEEFDLVESINEVLEELDPIISEKKQELRIKTPGSITINADKNRISQVFINLIQNANKFTPEGGQIKIEIEELENTAEITIMDNGIGLSEKDLSKLFEPFPSIRHGKNVRSTGLGLAISKGILELHGGKIIAESKGAGKGSKFHISIPYLDD